MVWRVNRDRSFPLAGMRSLMVQALHPLAMAGVAQHSNWRQDPFGRLAATSSYLLTTTYGDSESALAAAKWVRKVHVHVHGVDPETGLPYSAEDPSLLLWVHAGMVDSIVTVVERYGRPLEPADADRYVAEMVRFAEIVGVPREDVPATVASRRALRIGGRYVARSPRLLFASVERRGELRHDLALRSADEVAEELGSMKGVLMKLGQMASYIYEDMPLTFRAAMSRLQHRAPPMTGALASSVIVDELGDVPDRVFAEWDPVPIAAASIGQVHRAITRDGRAVAVKIQYPGIARSITSDLRNVGLLRRIVGAAFPGLDTRSLVDELGERLQEEVDYSREAENQEMFARFYDGHPVIRVPRVLSELSTPRVLTSELVSGAPFDELLQWDQHETDLAAETIYRFVFRSLYRLHAFNGDPHPGNYLFQPGGRVTFLDFGLVKRFSPTEIDRFARLVQEIAIRHDVPAFRRSAVEIGFLRDDTGF